MQKFIITLWSVMMIFLVTSNVSVNGDVQKPAEPIIQNHDIQILSISPSYSTQKICDEHPEENFPDLAKRGCCSHHSGVCGCDEALDKIVCCDGTLSPSCTCSGY